MSIQKKKKTQPGPVLARVLGYMLKDYKWSFGCVVICNFGLCPGNPAGDALYAEPDR